MKPRLIGITGTIGSGKSTVGKILQDKGIDVVDTDQLVHRLLSEDTETRQKVIDRFGRQIVSTNGQGAIDRSVLGKLVFADQKLRKDLEAIVHPATVLMLHKQIEALKDKPVIAVLVPLLFEAGLESSFDEVWTVVTDEALLKERLQKRDSLPQTAIENRLSAQMPQSQKMKGADQIIDNSGSTEQTRQQVNKLISSHKAR